MMRVRESEKPGLNSTLKKKIKIVASGPMTSWQIEGEKVEAVGKKWEKVNRFYFPELQNHCRQQLQP